MGELTNNLRKQYASLATPKGRREHNLFMAQGTKCMSDTIDFFEVHTLICTQTWLDKHRSMAEIHDVTLAKKADMERISSLSSAPDVIAVYKIPEEAPAASARGLIIALDGVQDPGNLGTIIRLAVWMGVNTIVASPSTADVWGPKVVQSTMGAIARINMVYTDLPTFLRKHGHGKVYGTFLDGEDIYYAPLTADGIIVMGNEGNGISPEVAEMVNKRLYIPPYPKGAPASESLNVAMATAITLSEFRRRIM